jgi:hypothetical protein
MTAIRMDTQGIATSVCRYGLSLWRALDRERLEFFDPFRIAAQIAFRASQYNPTSMPAFFQLLQYNNSLLNRATWANAEKLTNYMWDEGQKSWSSYINTMFGLEGETLEDFACRQADIMEAVSNFNERIEKVKEISAFTLTRRTTNWWARPTPS